MCYESMKNSLLGGRVKFDEFSVQIERLKSVYGEKTYSEERCRILWDDVKQMPGGWFKNCVDEFIGSMRTPPLVKEFLDKISDFREKQNAFAKKQIKEETKEILESGIISSFLRNIANGLRGNLDPEEKKSMLKFLDSTSKSKCNICSDSGYVFRKRDDYEFVSRCFCAAGNLLPLKIPRSIQINPNLI